MPGLGPEGGDYRMMWGRRAFFGYTVSPDGEVWWFANPPADREPTRDELAADSHEEVRDELAALFAGDEGPAARIIAATEEPMLRSSDHHLPTVPTWHRDRMVLVGDAAHAVSPSSGQGVSLACEDAVVLALALARHPSADPSAALADYESSRRKRVQRVVTWGKRTSNSKAPGPVGRVIRDALMPLFLRMGSSESAMNRQRWLFEHHLEWPVAPAPVSARR